ncbi:MAG: hypothetical protein QXM02_07855 [Thermoproteota archaeon]|nr:hypothetical protein [Candidatus Brockarchaeota archaeon]
MTFKDLKEFVFYCYIDKEGRIWNLKDKVRWSSGHSGRCRIAELQKDDLQTEVWINPKKARLGLILPLREGTVQVSSTEVTLVEIPNRRFHLLEPLNPNPALYRYYYDSETGLLFRKERDLYDEMLWLEHTSFSFWATRYPS